MNSERIYKTDWQIESTCSVIREIVGLLARNQIPSLRGSCEEISIEGHLGRMQELFDEVSG